jgi:hypothetical protein
MTAAARNRTATALALLMAGANPDLADQVSLNIVTGIYDAD